MIMHFVFAVNLYQALPESVLLAEKQNGTLRTVRRHKFVIS
jgi:hypothetical protein